MRLLVVEDEIKMLGLLKRGFQEEGYAVDTAGTVEDAVWLGVDTDYGAIILDLTLPDGDGFDVCRRLRAADQWAPIVMLTARDGVTDRIKGLDSGADDYLTKPFSFDELSARIRALLRRGKAPRPVTLSVGPLVLDPAGRSLTVYGHAVALTALEFSLLEALLRRDGEVLTRNQIRECVWDHAFEGDSNVVDVYIRYLREKVDRPYGLQLIETVRGVGYRIRRASDFPTHPH